MEKLSIPVNGPGTVTTNLYNPRTNKIKPAQSFHFPGGRFFKKNFAVTRAEKVKKTRDTLRAVYHLTCNHGKIKDNEESVAIQ